MKKLSSVPTLYEISEAHAAIRPHIHRTPVLTCTSMNELAGCKIFFKCENFQKGCAFKMRGTMCAVLSLSRKEKANGIATHSSDNHAQAVALAAKRQGIPAYIVMPEKINTEKQDIPPLFPGELSGFRSRGKEQVRA